MLCECACARLCFVLPACMNEVCSLTAVCPVRHFGADALITAINDDIRHADEMLSRPAYEAFREDMIFKGGNL